MGLFQSKQDKELKAYGTMLRLSSELAADYAPVLKDKLGFDPENSRARNLLVSAVYRMEMGGFDGDEQQQLEELFKFIAREIEYDISLAVPGTEERIAAKVTSLSQALKAKSLRDILPD
jgi:hypothetical protein